MKNDEIWTNVENTPLQEIPLTTELDLSEKLKQAFKNLLNESGSQISYCHTPLFKENFWICGCGQLNINETCIKCNITKSQAEKLLDKPFLEKSRDTYLLKLQKEEAENMNLREIEEAKRLQVQNEEAAEHLRLRNEKIEKTKEKAKRMLQFVKSALSKGIGKIVQTTTKVKGAVIHDEIINNLETDKFCVYCGTELNDNANFCAGCGKAKEDAK